MLSWQKRVRIALAVLLVALVAVVLLAVWARRQPDLATDVPPRIDQKASVEVPGGGSFTHTQDGREVFTVRFERQLIYPDGRSVLSGVRVTFRNPGGKTFVITAREARQTTSEGKRIGALTFDGDVRMTGDDGLSVETPSASYDESSGLVRAPGQVTFARGRVSGSGVGATYDQARDTLWLLDQARIAVAADAEGQGASNVTAGAAGLARRDRYVRLERAVVITSLSQSATAETAMIFLAPDEERLDRVELAGNASVTGTAEGASGVRAMRGQDIALDYADDGRTLERASLRGNASADLAATGGPRTLSAGAIDARLGPGGHAVTSLTASDDVLLVLPADGSAPARQIRSARLDGHGDAQGIRTLVFAGGVQYRESRAGSEPGRDGAAAGQPASDRTAVAETLDVTVKPGFGAAEEARFRGRVTFRDGALRAEAPDVRYALERGAIQLSQAEAGSSAPRVVDERVSVEARAIELTVGAKRLVAKGDVRSVLQPSKGDGVVDDRRVPVMLQREAPVNVTGAELAYDGDAGRATYTGAARLWQGETSIQGDLLELDDKNGNLVVTGNAQSRLKLEQKETALKGPTRARADRLAYDHAARKATYDGHAHFTGPQAEVSADRIELFLDESGRALERAEAYTNVAARFEGGHRATGTRLTYVADGERYTMSGAPVRILEKLSDGCRETVGAALTFVRSTDTISVVGNEGSRSKTTPGPCAELR